MSNSNNITMKEEIVEDYTEGLSELLEEAGKVYLDNFPNKTGFERAIFFSWGCTIGDCKFCYMSIQEKHKQKEARRGQASIIAEMILCKELNWDIGFFTGGINVLSDDEVEFLLTVLNEIAEEKIWLSVGPLSKQRLERYKPLIRGIVGSVETVNPVLHDKICPSKPIKPYEDMFQNAIELGLERAMTFIVGMGETKEDWPLFVDFIERNKIEKIHIYGFIPHEGTDMENIPPPSKEQESWWIAKFRIQFPKLDIQCGIWDDRLDYIPMLLEAGSNSISKLKAMKFFGTDTAKEIVRQAKTVREEFTSEIVKIPDVDWHKKIDELKSLPEENKQLVKDKLDIYIKLFNKNIKKNKL